MGMKLFWKFIIYVAFPYTSWHIFRYIFVICYHNRSKFIVTARCSKMVFISLISHLWLTDMSHRVEHQQLNQVAAELPPGWVFGVQLGLRQTQALIEIQTIRRGKVPPTILLISIKLLLFTNIAGGSLPLLIVLVLISACVCRRPRWTPKTQPNSAVNVWLSFWCSTRFTWKKWFAP